MNLKLVGEQAYTAHIQYYYLLTISQLQCLCVTFFFGFFRFEVVDKDCLCFREFSPNSEFGMETVSV